MIKIVGIQFKGMGKVYYFDPLEFEFENGEHAIVETVRGLELGKVIIGNRMVEDDQIEYELKPVQRKATEADLENEKKNNELAQKSFLIFKKYIRQCNLDMKPLYCEYTIDQTKIIFYYSADDRVDFRDLLKLLTPEFRIRVELRQIGPREAARVIGGIGECGRELCCKTYLQNFDFVTMKMAKEQGMSLNTNKISGQCGKLMCCIAYENELYKEFKKEFPAIGSEVNTPTCACCKVVGVDYLKRLVKTQENPSGSPAVHPLAQIHSVDFTSNMKEPESIVTAEMNNDNEVIIEEVPVQNNDYEDVDKKPNAEVNRKKKKPYYVKNKNRNSK